jgi:hypothetical protein
MNTAIALTAFACPTVGKGERNQQKSGYLSQNNTGTAVNLSDWLNFGPKWTPVRSVSTRREGAMLSRVKRRWFIPASRLVAIRFFGACIVASGWL